MVVVKKKLAFLKKFSRDVWNLRLVTKVLGFRYLSDFPFPSKGKIPETTSFAITYKYFFIYFFKKYKQYLQRVRKKARPFVYRIDLVERRPRFKRWKKRFVSLRLVKQFYALLSYKQFRQISKAAKLKSGWYEQNYLLGLECRLVNFLYRTGIAETVFRSLFIIRGGFLSKNNQVCTFPNEKVEVFDFLTFSPQIVYSIYIEYFMRIFHFNLLHPPIRCIFLSIIFLFFYLFRAPRLKDIPNRKMINLYRLTGYAIIH